MTGAEGHDDQVVELPTLIDRLVHNASSRPDQVALIDARSSVTYRELWRRAQGAARVLSSAGVGAGDRVLHIGRDETTVYELLYGVALLGAVLVPVNWRLSEPEVDYIIDHSQAKLLVSAEARPGVSGAAITMTCDDFSARVAGAGSADWTAFPATADTPVVQMYTSGTTGFPKGVVLAHRSFFAVRDLLDRSGLDWIDWRDGDRSLIALGSFHIGGMWWAAQGLNAGITNIILPAFTPDAALSAIRRQRVSTTCMAPAMILMLLAEPGVVPADFASLRKVVYGGAPIGAELLERALATMGCDFGQIYGLTETGNTAVCLPPAAHRRPGAPLAAAGYPYPGIELQVRDSRGNVVSGGESGEVFVRTPARMVEYFRNPEATAQTLVDGWVRTGDAGYLDDDGLLYLHDRVKDLIIVAGENVYPAEVEKVINTHPAVSDSAVVGVPDQGVGESVHAVVVATEGADLTARDLMRFLATRLAGFKLPATVEFTSEIPRNPAGKTLRRVVRERYWVGRDRNIN
ncbi:AMP-binding protein [Gordonia crocea]|uniref:Acyl-CoA synthetase n=1 Tax=Gordonia crocea TaxID=589162 RepID=A0A7I9V052_9ACTN|nr:AMP-binding protein [Gordonia crocea]GED98562.1 acyl-CoA synthetase [Gordonia crocea]